MLTYIEISNLSYCGFVSSFYIDGFVSSFYIDKVNDKK